MAMKSAKKQRTNLAHSKWTRGLACKTDALPIELTARAHCLPISTDFNKSRDADPKPASGRLLYPLRPQTAKAARAA